MEQGSTKMSSILYEPTETTFGGSYNRWRETRISKLEQMFGREWFKGKRILELACAYGNLGLYLKTLGADVTFADARQEHLDVVKQKDSSARTILLDQDTNWNLNERFDLVLHFGVLYHLQNWIQDLESTVKHSNLIILESAVANTSYSFHYHLPEESEGGQNAFNGIGSLPSATNIEFELQRLKCKFQRHDDPSLNTNHYKYDWTAEPNNLEGIEVKSFEDAPLYGGRRFWVIET